MSHKLTLYHKALLAWKRELEKQHKAALEEKQENLREGMFKKLVKMFGADHFIEINSETLPNELIQQATVENLHFLALRCPIGKINIVLLEPCPRCGYKMTSTFLSSIADLGRELLQYEMKGTLSNHECSFDSDDSSFS